MSYNVLIVDDSPAMRSFVRRVLDVSGIDVGACWQAGDGQEALRLLHDQWVDIVLTDINMPTMDGEQLLHRLAEDDVLRTVPVLVISTDSTDGRVQRMLTLGAKGYVAKPFSPEMLRAELEKALGVVDVG